jgi:hypothetical protein
MKHCLILFFSTLILNFLMAYSLCAQPWSFVKEKKGIKVFTRIEPNNLLKSFKGEITLHAPVDKISTLIMDPDHSDWWKINFVQSELLEYKANKYVQYYLVYGLPWPLANRDFAAETIWTKDSVTGGQTMTSLSMLNKVPPKPDLIRINKYLQKWTLQPLDEQTVHVILEGFIDPGGNLPAWIYNIVIPEAPFKIINSLRERLISDSLVQAGQ